MLLFIFAIALFFVSVWNFCSYMQDVRERKALFIVKFRDVRRQCAVNS